MTKSALISCIVPVYNGERYLAEAIDSILSQTYRPLEVIVVDDGSTDDTALVAAQYGEHITYLYQPNAGPAAARNFGLSKARGEFIAFLDADDLWEPKKLARQMTCFQADAALSLCLTHVCNFWSPELDAAKEQHKDDQLLAPWSGYTCNSLLARRDVFTKVGLFNPEMIVGEDGDWFMRAGHLQIKHKMLPDVLTYRRLHQNNLTRRMAQASRDVLLNRVKIMVDHRKAN